MTYEVEQHPEWLAQAGLVPAPLHASALLSSTCPCRRWIKSRGRGHSKVSFQKHMDSFLTPSWLLKNQDSVLEFPISPTPWGNFPVYWFAKSKITTLNTCQLNKNRFITFCPKDTATAGILCHPGGNLPIVLYLVNGWMMPHLSLYCPLPLTLNIPSLWHILLPGPVFALWL